MISHCSWGFFNDRPYEENKEPKDYSIKYLKDYKEDKAHIIASSKKIINKKPNPPHYPAKIEYENIVGKGYLKNTGVNKNEKAPEPLIYTISEDGFTLDKEIKKSSTKTLTTGYRAG